MPKFVVKKFAEFVCEVVVDAENEEDAFHEAKIALPESWSEWESTSDDGYIEYDYIEEVKNES